MEIGPVRRKATLEHAEDTSRKHAVAPFICVGDRRSQVILVLVAEDWCELSEPQNLASKTCPNFEKPTETCWLTLFALANVYIWCLDLLRNTEPQAQRHRRG